MTSTWIDMSDRDGNHEHLTDGTIAAYLDGELPPDARATVEEHREGCDSCDRRIRELEGAAEAVEQASAAARQPPEELRGTRFTESAPPSRHPSLRAAAVIAAVLVGGAAVADAALPGHPIRSWLGNTVSSVMGTDREASPGQPGWGGLSVEPDAGSVRVEITGAPDGTSVMVRFVDAPRASVTARGGTFRSGSGSLEVTDPGEGQIRVRVPSLATRVRVSADGRSLLAKRNGDLRLLRSAMRDSSARRFRFIVREGAR